jgi:Xaa-Pro aminopeptidase
MLLIDSGGQYWDGTTDITRTITLGEPTEEEISAFTQVLKGHINLATAHFPAGTTGGQLDALARIHLWKAGRNYGHGTGHGVGFFLNVHEGPQNISPLASSPRGRTPFQPGMITSNEPGYYKQGEFGIRTENLILCVESEHSTEEQAFLKFETLTLFPIDFQLVDIEALSQQEIGWLNAYHRRVYESLSPHLAEVEQEWLAEKCQMVR